MNEWDEAARKAAKDIATYTLPTGNDEGIYAIDIAEAYADLRSTYEKLVELVRAYHRREEIEYDDGSLREYNHLDRRIVKLRSDPLVQKAIEGSKE